MKIIFIIALIIVCLSGPNERNTTDLSCKVHILHKKDSGNSGVNQQKCEELGCCWKEDSNPQIQTCF